MLELQSAMWTPHEKSLNAGGHAAGTWYVAFINNQANKISLNPHTQTDAPVIINEPASPLLGQPSDSQRLRVLTDFSGVPPLPPPKDETTPTSQFSHSALLSPEKGLVVEHLKPSHLRLNHFGSRFIPHTTAPIRCILPLPAEELVLLGHDDGLSVLNMFPSEWNEHGLVSKGPGDAQARPVWEGEG
jgi:hypothetical protein